MPPLGLSSKKEVVLRESLSVMEERAYNAGRKLKNIHNVIAANRITRFGGPYSEKPMSHTQG